jgi:four helix bundle protein
MSSIADAIQDKCLAFGDRVLKLNDYLLEQAANKHQPSAFRHRTSRVPVHLQSVAALANQLLRSGTSIGANNAEVCNAVSKQDFRSKSYIALKEARKSLYWIELLKRNNYIDERQYQSIYADCEELVKILVTRCKKLDQELGGK